MLQELSLLTTFIASVPIAFYTIIIFPNLRETSVLISIIIGFEVCFLLQVAASFVDA